MSYRLLAACSLGLALAVGACSTPASGPTEGSNPFLDDQSPSGKEDTAYQNPDGIEVEIDFEADVVGPEHRLPDGPAEVAQFALTYLRKRGTFYLESLAEDTASDGRAEWLVDGNWVSAEQARALPRDKLRRFRIRGMNAVLLEDAMEGARDGAVYAAVVPLKPFTLMADAGDSCAEPDGHIHLDQSVYWYLWNPEKTGCRAEKQDARITISRMLPRGNVTYPEYDQLVADGKVTVVILFGQIGDGAITDSDPGMSGFRRFAAWLGQAGFREVTPAPVGRRFAKHIGAVDVEVDLYSPHDFSGLSDHAHFGNFQRAIGEHEIVAYDGHSMLGASDFWTRPEYPAFYQVFLYGGCLGYEYYLRPILAGKGGWEKLDILSSVVEVTASANEFAGPWLAKFFWGLENGYRASWRDLLVAVRQRVYDSTFGASGVRDNCFSPGGSLCGQPPAPTGTRRFESATAVAIPDNAPAGVASRLEVSEAITPRTVTVELEIEHPYVGDLRVVLEHDGTQAVLWDRTGGSQDDIRQSFTLPRFANRAAAGAWTLKAIDAAAEDVGTLRRWAIVLTP